jgi:para-nitrobenzyl esterase
MSALIGAGRTSDLRSPLVVTHSGAVRGRYRNGVQAFTGIPYGEPPIGPLRFSAPRPARPWRGEFHALRDASTPPQNDDPALPPVAPPSEDCLELNVWVPQGVGPFPVFFWIYGGGNSTGAINQPAYQGDTFARDGVVFVSCNYRVGVLGFLELGGIMGPAHAGSGNNAIRDQLLALEWVRTNIAAFGGDPRNVTIGGQSAGAWNCSTLLALPAAKGLFQKVIIASGGGDAAYTPERAGDFARLFVARLGGAERLRLATTAQILEAQQQAQANFDDWIPYRPVIDGTFLPAEPVELVRAGCAQHIATLIGHTRDEYRTFLSPTEAAGSITQKMLLHLRLADLPGVERAYQAAFPALMPGQRMLKLLGDEFLGMPTLQLAEAQTAAGAPVFYYRLDYAIPRGPFGPYSAHGIDVPLFFDHVDTAFARKVFGFDETDRAMAQTVHAAWVSFIKSGRIDAGFRRWPRYELEHRKTLLIDRTPVVAEDPEGKERSIWSSLPSNPERNAT